MHAIQRVLQLPRVGTSSRAPILRESEGDYYRSSLQTDVRARRQRSSSRLSKSRAIVER